MHRLITGHRGFCELIPDLPHMISLLLIRGSVFWPLLLGGWLPILPPSYVVLVETSGRGQIVRLDLPEEQHNSNKLFEYTL